MLFAICVMYKANFKKEEHEHIKHTVRTNHQLKGVPTAALRAFLFANVSIISLKSSASPTLTRQPMFLKKSTASGT